MNPPEAYLYLNDHRLQVDNLTDADGVPQNAATVTATMRDAASGVACAGQTWPLVLMYVAASAGVYQGVVQYDLEVTEGQRLTLDVDVVSGGTHGHWEVPVSVRVRED